MTFMQVQRAYYVHFESDQDFAKGQATGTSFLEY